MKLLQIAEVRFLLCVPANICRKNERTSLQYNHYLLFWCVERSASTVPIKGHAISFFFINWRFATLNWRSPLWTGDRHFELAIRYFELAIATLNSRFASLNRTSDDHYEVAIATLSWRFATLNWRSPLWTGESLLWTGDRHFELVILWTGDCTTVQRNCRLLTPNMASIISM